MKHLFPLLDLKHVNVCPLFVLYGHQYLQHAEAEYPSYCNMRQIVILMPGTKLTSDSICDSSDNACAVSTNLEAGDEESNIKNGVFEGTAIILNTEAILWCTCASLAVYAISLFT